LSFLKLLLPRGQPPVLPPPEVDPEDQGGHKKASGPKDEAGEREGEAAHAQTLLCVELRGHLSCNTRMYRIKFVRFNMFISFLTILFLFPANKVASVENRNKLTL
jgi:hypothetical protein